METVSLISDMTLLEMCIDDGHCVVDAEGVVWVDAFETPKREEITRYLRETESLCDGQFYAKAPEVRLTNATRIQSLLDVAKAAREQKSEAELESEFGDKLRALCQSAVNNNASDIHIEVHRHQTRLYLRVDGRRERLLTFSNGESAQRLDQYIGHALAAYTFNLGNSNYSPRLPINDRFELPLQLKKSQIDGAEVTQMVTSTVEWRAAMMPLSHGIKLVLRCLTPLDAPLDLEHMDLLPSQVDLLVSKMQRRQGIIVLTGPMGSGKSSLVYALLETVDRVARCCHTLEDPVEFEQDLVTKTVVEPKRELKEGTGQYLDYTFYAQEQLRQDINITVFGELREASAAKEFCRKGETGGIALTTLHANSASGVASIFTEQLDIPVSVVSSPDLMQLFTHQKLIRKLCPHCALSLHQAETVYEQAGLADEYQQKTLQLQTLLPESLELVRVAHPEGCTDCKGKGEKGRLMVLELIALEDKDREFINQKDYLGWKRYLQAQGWPDIRQHALHRIALGQVDIASASEEVDGLMPISAKSIYSQMEMDRQTQLQAVLEAHRSAALA
jgi:general secretion pathway protein E